MSLRPRLKAYNRWKARQPRLAIEWGAAFAPGAKLIIDAWAARIQSEAHAALFASRQQEA